MKKILPLVILIFIAFWGCKNKSNKNKSEIIVHLLSDPDKLNPYTSTTADASYMERFLFQKLIDWNYEKNDFEAVLAVSRPKITPFNNGLKIEYEIKPEAKWDNGTDITAYDVAFSYKAVLNPKTSCEHIRPYFKRWIQKIEIDSTNPKKFTIYSKEKYILVEEYSGYWVMPEYIYDADKIMRQFTIEQLNDTNSLKTNQDIVKFAEQFNSQKFMREKGGIVGSGPYEFVEWNTGSSVVFKRKSNWWGRNSKDTALQNIASIETLKFKVINDWSTTTTAIKGGGLDCIHSIEFKSFNELKSDSKFNENYNAFTPSADQYVYIGINMSNPKLKDIKVRQAMAHSLDKNLIIETLLYGLGQPIESMVHPSKNYYNKNLKSFDYNIEMANKILDEAGWIDKDGDGVREKMINGRSEALKLEFKYNSGNETRKNIGLIFKENLKKIGIEVNMVSKEFTIFIDDLKKHDFEVYCGGWVGDPNVEDPTQLWHTESAKGGSNYVNYGDMESDRLIDQIAKELNPEVRNQLYMKFQEKVHNEIPYIFIYAPNERMAFSKRFTNTKAYTARPGFDLNAWKLSK